MGLSFDLANTLGGDGKRLVPSCYTARVPARLKLGIDTAADEDGKAVHETCYARQITDAPRNPPATPAND